MATSNPVDYLEIATIRTTPCCNRAIASVCETLGNRRDTGLNGTTLIKCIECDKSYAVTISDSLITSITPIEDAIT